ncbi:aminoglycoside phosphotransferase family protein, partial [Paraburkholderia dipogonis]
CLNHLLLKCLALPDARDGFIDCFATLAEQYLQKVSWEPAVDLEARAASLLPALMLARVDGKSPVEYIVREEHKDRVRVTACGFLHEPAARLMEVADAWRAALTPTP